MSAAWIGMCGLALLIVLLIRDAITEICQEEVKTRLSLLPYALLQLVALRTPHDARDDVLAEWRAELDFILRDTDGLPVTRLWRGIAYSASLLRIMLPGIGTHRARLPLLPVDHPQLGGVRLIAKGLFDRCVAAAVLILLAPLLAVMATAIWLFDRGPALLAQVRVGKDGQVFRLYKFRTMVVDAERRRAQLLATNVDGGIPFKPRTDPRVTAIGAKLRRWSIDELPQLVNVCLGNMSLVGPRPALPDEAAKYADHVRRRLVVKPGLTGLWQVNGRSDLSWDESIRLDLRYVENWSFALDLQILWKTISVLLRGAGAY